MKPVVIRCFVTSRWLSIRVSIEVLFDTTWYKSQGPLCKSPPFFLRNEISCAQAFLFLFCCIDQTLSPMRVSKLSTKAPNLIVHLLSRQIHLRLRGIKSPMMNNFALPKD